MCLSSVKNEDKSPPLSLAQQPQQQNRVAINDTDFSTYAPNAFVVVQESFPGVAVSCSVLQSVAVSCSVVLCGAVCCSIVQCVERLVVAQKKISGVAVCCS